MPKQVICTKSAPTPVGPYSQAIKVGQFIFTSGQAALDPKTGKVATGDFKTQVRRSLENIKAILEAAGATMEDVIKATVLINDMKNWSLLNEVWVEYFKGSLPARTCIQAGGLDSAVEIDVIAFIPKKRVGEKKIKKSFLKSKM
jgi:2-iminobutanoate/2-iminopropanoate deaminase